MVVDCFSEPPMRKKNVVCKSDVGEVRVGVAFGKSDSVVTSLPLCCLWFHDLHVLGPVSCTASSVAVVTRCSLLRVGEAKNGNVNSVGVSASASVRDFHWPTLVVVAQNTTLPNATWCSDKSRGSPSLTRFRRHMAQRTQQRVHLCLAEGALHGESAPRSEESQTSAPEMFSFWRETVPRGKTAPTSSSSSRRNSTMTLGLRLRSLLDSVFVVDTVCRN